MKVYVELEMEWNDLRVINMIADRVGLDPESTIRMLIRKGIESLATPRVESGKEESTKKKGGEKK